MVTRRFEHVYNAEMSTIRISDYLLGPVLGTGTVGTIFAATHRSSGERFAIKRLHASVGSNALIRARFKLEMTILSRLRHPNIISCYGCGEDESGLYYVMEFIDSGTVRELLQSTGPLAWQVVVDITRQVCSALQYAHNHGVIHRDLKPGNLFLTRDGQVKLGDFGIARDLTGADLTDHGVTVGTHAYMSPEQITLEQPISGKTDLYALGCCMFEMLSGRTPFIGENFPRLFDQHLRAAPPHVQTLVTNVPHELDEIIDRMLAKDQEDRPHSARQVQGVMLQIGEQYALGTKSPHSSTLAQSDSPSAVSNEIDTPAAQVTELGRMLLARQLEAQWGTTRRDVSWTKLAALAGVLLVIAVLASLAKLNS
jgi:serine/threonine protein kinase